jgi:dihydroorotate dehydrogenase (fumarate)
MDLKTTYLGLTLENPFVAGASPLTAHLDNLKRLEDCGAAAVVLPSLFEEQITLAQSGRIHHMDPHDEQFAGVLTGFLAADRYPLSPDEYLEHIRRAKASLRVPVMASLNGLTGESWAAFAQKIQQAGADALELNMYDLITDPHVSAAHVETQIKNLVVELGRRLVIPLAVKLSPFFTALGHVAHQLAASGAAGLVLFNRFYYPDVDIDTMSLAPQIGLSTSAELLLRLRWTAILRPQLTCSLAVTGGVASATDGIKALLAGADAVQVVSATLRRGPEFFTSMRSGLVEWMEQKGLGAVAEFRGRAAARVSPDGLVERANYLRTLQSWNA